jgi:hypothetical protein
MASLSRSIGFHQRPQRGCTTSQAHGRVDPVSRTIKVFGEIRGGAAELTAGMSGRANIPPPK